MTGALRWIKAAARSLSDLSLASAVAPLMARGGGRAGGNQAAKPALSSFARAALPIAPSEMNAESRSDDRMDCTAVAPIDPFRSSSLA